MLFDNNKKRVIECDLSKLRAVSEIPSAPTMIELNAHILKAFEVFIRLSPFDVERKVEQERFVFLFVRSLASKKKQKFFFSIFVFFERGFLFSSLAHAHCVVLVYIKKARY